MCVVLPICMNKHDKSDEILILCRAHRNLNELPKYLNNSCVASKDKKKEKTYIPMKLNLYYITREHKHYKSLNNLSLLKYNNDTSRRIGEYVYKTKSDT